MPITTLVSDFSRVILFPRNQHYRGTLSSLYRQESQKEDFKFHHHFTFNYDYLDFLQTTKLNEMYILTANTLVDVPEIQMVVSPLFRDIFKAQDFKYSKKQPQLYRQILEQTHTKPSQAIFVDDTLKNVKAALHAGLQATHFHDTRKLLEHLQTLLQ